MKNLVGAVLSGSASVTSGLFTTLLILFYMLVSGETFLRRMVEILPRFKDKRQAVELSQHIERDVSAYLLTVTCINAIVGVATGCVMWLCGVANPVLWGAVAFVLNFVPILGAMVGIAVFLMASVVSLGVSWWALLPVGLYFGIHVIEGEFVTPMLLARRFTINPVAVILALIFWYWMWGVDRRDPGGALAGDHQDHLRRFASVAGVRALAGGLASVSAWSTPPLSRSFSPDRRRFVQGIEFTRVELDAPFFLRRHDDLDLLKAVPAFDVLSGQGRGKLDIVAHEHVRENLGQITVDFDLSRHGISPRLRG